MSSLARVERTGLRPGSTPVLPTQPAPARGAEPLRTAEVIRLDDYRPRRGGSLVPPCVRPRGRVAVSIYRPARSAVQSGRANTKRWVLEFPPTSPLEADPLMGWLGSTDTRKQVRLTFPTRESAIAFAERHGWDCTVYEPRGRAVRPKSYAQRLTGGAARAAA